MTEQSAVQMLSLRALTARLIADRIVDTISRQRVAQLAREDPAFPLVVVIGRSHVVDYREACAYFAGWKPRPGRRRKT